MFKIFNFHCKKCDVISDKLVKSNAKTAECSKCGSKMNKTVSAAKYFSNTTGKSPAVN